MPVQELIDKLIQVGGGYQDQHQASPGLFGTVKSWIIRHDNQAAAKELKTIDTCVDKNVPEKLQEAQLLLGLVDILNRDDFVSSTELMTGIKKALSEYPAFKELDKYLPAKSDKKCPVIVDLRDALTKYGELLLTKYKKDQAVNEAKLKDQPVSEPKAMRR